MEPLVKETVLPAAISKLPFTKEFYRLDENENESFFCRQATLGFRSLHYIIYAAFLAKAGTFIKEPEIPI